MKTVDVDVHFVACGCGWYALQSNPDGLSGVLASHRAFEKCKSTSSHLGSRHFTARPWAER